MDSLITLYKALAAALGPPVVLAAALRGRFGGRWRERLGFPPKMEARPDGPRLWFHGASAGECRTAAAIIRAVRERRPEAGIVLSIGTPAGLKLAGEMFAGQKGVTVIAPPLDFWGAPARAVRRLAADALVIVETELWPGLITAAAGRTRLCLAAGRLTPRSFSRYRLVKKTMARLLARFDLLAVASPAEAERFLALGAPEAAVRTLGTPKFDGLFQTAGQAAPPDPELVRALWGGPENRAPLLVAGSTHAGEEETVLEAYLRLLPEHPRLGLALAPRHLTRAGRVAGLAMARGLGASLFSRQQRPLLNGPGVVVLDVMGRLPGLYALATAALVGGSLFGGHGHNPLEPAAAATPVIFGPFMDSFASEARELLAAGGARRLSAAEAMADQLTRVFKELLDSPGAAEQTGLAARRCLLSRPPAGPALAEAVLRLPLSKNVVNSLSERPPCLPG